jgi:hypothetical protein
MENSPPPNVLQIKGAYAPVQQYKEKTMKTETGKISATPQLITACPFFDQSGPGRKISCTTPSATQQLTYCETEDYDNCPLFLSRLLRNSRPKFRGVLDLALK